MPATKERGTRNLGARPPDPGPGMQDQAGARSIARRSADRRVAHPITGCILKWLSPRPLRNAIAILIPALSAVAAGMPAAPAAAGAPPERGTPARIEPVPADRLDQPAPPLLPPLDRPPLDPPLRLTGTFGELRGGHFHGGVDFSTGGGIGRPVYAALSGTIERVRTSGAGYGRSLYLRSRDGRLLVYGHLDQFVQPIAEYVEAFQDSTGQYEQDLWPDAARFHFRAGDLLAWSGRSPISTSRCAAATSPTTPCAPGSASKTRSRR